MTLAMPRPSKVNYLPSELASLAHRIPPARPGTLFVRGLYGRISGIVLPSNGPRPTPANTATHPQEKTSEARPPAGSGPR
jgi:hypothetical protein